MIEAKSHKTIRLYRLNPYEKTSISHLRDIQFFDNYSYLVFDKSPFFPEGGGQSSDIGTVSFNSGLTLHIDYVMDRDDIVYHRISEDDMNASLLQRLKAEIDKEASLEIDWPHRFDNMQRHLGEHILSGTFYKLFNGINKGFRMGEDYMTIDILLPENQKMTQDMIDEAEYLANTVIWSNLPVTTTYFDNIEEASSMPLRKSIDLDSEVSVVTVGDLDNPADCCPCCGTHPSTSGQVGLVKIYKFEPNKGMWRIYLEAGRRAFKKYQKDYATFDHICRDLSASSEDVAHKYNAKKLKMQQTSDRLHSAISSLTKMVGEDISEYLSSDEYLSGHLTTAFHFITLNDNEITRLGSDYAPKAVYPLICVDDNNHTVFLFSSGQRDVGQFVKDKASQFGGKGGGKATMARAKFQDKKSLHDFVTSMGDYFSQYE